MYCSTACFIPVQKNTQFKNYQHSLFQMLQCQRRQRTAHSFCALCPWEVEFAPFGDSSSFLSVNPTAACVVVWALHVLAFKKKKKHFWDRTPSFGLCLMSFCPDASAELFLQGYKQLSLHPVSGFISQGSDNCTEWQEFSKVLPLQREHGTMKSSHATSRLKGQMRPTWLPWPVGLWAFPGPSVWSQRVEKQKVP